MWHGLPLFPFNQQRNWGLGRRSWNPSRSYPKHLSFFHWAVPCHNHFIISYFILKLFSASFFSKGRKIQLIWSTVLFSFIHSSIHSTHGFIQHIYWVTTLPQPCSVTIKARPWPSGVCSRGQWQTSKPSKQIHKEITWDSVMCYK